jgi:hypothetical protein
MHEVGDPRCKPFEPVSHPQPFSGRRRQPAAVLLYHRRIPGRDSASHWLPRASSTRGGTPTSWPSGCFALRRGGLRGCKCDGRSAARRRDRPALLPAVRPGSDRAPPRRELRAGGHRAGRLAGDSDPRRITAERGDVFPHPLQRGDLIEGAEVARAGQATTDMEEAIQAKPIIQRHSDDAAARERAAVVQRVAAGADRRGVCPQLSFSTL